MEENDNMVSVLVPSCPEDLPIAEGTHIVEEGPRVCPLCGSEVKFFFVNFKEQMLMCENFECEFPFGYDDFQINRYEEGTISDIVSLRTKHSQSSQVSPTASVISTHAWSEIEKINKIYDSEDSQLERSCFEIHTKKKKTKKKFDKDSIDKIQKNVEHIKGLNMELMELSEPKRIIKNEKWIKKLLNLQGTSGSGLLKPQELKQLKNDKKRQPEIKIDIQPGDNNTMSSIKIDLA